MKRIIATVMLLGLCEVFSVAAEFDLAQVNAGAVKNMEIAELPVSAAVQARDTAASGIKAGPSLHDAVNAMIDAEMEAYLDLNEVAPEIVKGYYYEYSQYTNAKKHTDAAMADALAFVQKAGAELHTIHGLLNSAADGSAGDIGDIYVEGGMLDISVIYLSRCELEIGRIKSSGRKRPEIINVIDTELKRVRAEYEVVQPFMRELGGKQKLSRPESTERSGDEVFW